MFRRAAREDLVALVSLLGDDELGQTRERLPVDGEVDDAYSRAFTAIDADDHQLLVVADLRSTIVGTLQLTFIPNLTNRGGERAQSEGVRLRREHRGSGLGGEMVGWAIEQARQRGCRLVQLTTDKGRPDARRFYKGLGFVASHVGMKLMM